MKVIIKILLIICLAVFTFSAGKILLADVPEVIDYHGLVKVDGVPFNGTGQFKFAIVNSAGTTSYWSNDGTSVSGSEPDNAVSIAVSNGIFDVRLGDTSLTNMRYSIPADIFIDYPDTYLRIWFDDGVNGSQHLLPDKQIVSVPYAHHAGQAANSDTLGGLSAPLAGELMGTTASQEISNKTIDGSSNTIQNVSDSALSQITTVNKVAGSAVQLASDSGLEDAGGLKVAAGSGLALGAGGLELDLYDAIVAPSGGDYSTVAAACAGAGEGATIFIKNGTYNEVSTIVLRNGQKLIGESRANVIINLGTMTMATVQAPLYSTGTVSVTNGQTTVTGSGTSWVANLSAEDYIILYDLPYLIDTVDSDTQLTLAQTYNGSSLSGAGYYAGSFHSGIELRNFTITSTTFGIFGNYGIINFEEVVNSVIADVTVKDNAGANQYGLQLVFCWANRFVNCNFESNYDAVYVQLSSNNQFSNIVVVNNIRYGIFLYSSSHYNILTNVHFVNNGYMDLFILASDYNKLSNMSAGGSITVNGDGNSISASTAEGITLGSAAEYNSLTGTVCTGTGDVISEDSGADYNLVVGCTADGISITGANSVQSGNVEY